MFVQASLETIRNRGLYFSKFTQQGHSYVRHIGRFLYDAHSHFSLLEASPKQAIVSPVWKGQGSLLLLLLVIFTFARFLFAFSIDELPYFFHLVRCYLEENWLPFQFAQDNANAYSFQALLASIVCASHMGVKAAKSFSFSLVRSVQKLTLNVPFVCKFCEVIWVPCS